MRTFLLSSLFALIAFLTAAPAHAQQSPAYGFFSDYNFNLYQADFRSFPGVPSCCPQYEDGTGGGLAIGLFYELPLAGQVRLALRGGYMTRSGAMKRTENTVVTGNVPAVFEHQVEASLADVGLEPLVGVNLFSSLWLSVGGRIAAVTSKQFSQREMIISPKVGVFPNGSSKRNEITDQPIPGAASVYGAIIGGLGYDVPLNSTRTLILSPEILFTLGITPVVSDVSWHSNAVRCGITLKYVPNISQ